MSTIDRTNLSDAIPENKNTDEQQQEEDEITPEKQYEIIKYIYVIGVFVFAGTLIILTNIWSDFKKMLDEGQTIVTDFFIDTDNSVLWIILCIALTTLMKAVGIKDPLSLRNISVIIFSYRCTQNLSDPVGMAFLLSMSIIGVLSSISKLCEYKVIGAELQIVQGKPVKFIFKYLRKLLLLFVKNEDTIKWIDPKYTISISEQSRNELQMNVYNNIYVVINGLIKKNKNKNNDSEEEQKWSNWRERMIKSIVFVIAVFWASVVEWIQPITELFLYAHNWRLTSLNVSIVILSEFADFDKMVEVYAITKELHKDGDIAGAKIATAFLKPAFWAIGYLVVMPLSLLWAYEYYHHYLEKEVDVDENENELCISKGGSMMDNEMLPPLDRTTTPLLDDSYFLAHGFENNNENLSKEEEDKWNLFKYKHQNDKIEKQPPVDKQSSTASTAL